MKGKLLTLWRMEKGLSKLDVCSAAKISQPTLDKAEKGLFTLKTWNKLVLFYNKKETVKFENND